MNKDHLLNSIESGKYFEDAIDWYCDKYLYCIVERAWLMLFSGILIIAIIIGAYNISTLFPIKKDFTLVKYVDLYTDEFSTLKKLAIDKEESEQISVSRYLVSQYVKKYESYSSNELNEQLNFIANNSSRRVYLKFKEDKNPNNINSKFALFKSNTKVNVIVEDVSLSMNLANFSNKALVLFKTIKMVDNVITETKNHKALINFTLSSIKMNAARTIPLEFIVNDYNVIE